MKRKMLALLCAVAVLVSVFATAVTAAEETDASRYQVGYSKLDVNPWVQSDYTGEIGIPVEDLQDADGNLVSGIVETELYVDGEIITQQIVSVPLSGYGTIAVRNASKMTDDNGDGNIGLGDGVFTTVTSVTDAWGTTVMYVTLDNINGVSQLTTAVRNAIVARLGSNVISANQIMLSASHSHEAPNLSECYSSWYRNDNTANADATGETTALGVYWLYYIERIADAAEEAYNSRSAADMTKGEIDASDSMQSMGYTYTDKTKSNYGEGFGLNYVRHYAYKTLVEKAPCTSSGTLTGSYEQVSVSWNVRGDNFGAGKTLGSTTTGPAKETWNSSTYYMTRTTVTVDHVSEVNENMYILQFERDEGDPIVLINWRAHASICGSSVNTNLSSDYINALRYRLENNKTLFGGDTNYCVGFWQAAAGNVNNTSIISSEYKFSAAYSSSNVGYTTIVLDANNDGKDDVKTPARSTVEDGSFYDSYYDSFGTSDDRIYRNSLYGYLLATVALDCLDSEMSEPLDTGKIRAIQNKYGASKQSYTEGQAVAASAWHADYVAGKTITYPIQYPYGDELIVLDSYYHAYNVYTRTCEGTTYDPNGTTTMELNAIIMGENVSLVTGTGELFDRYSSEHTYEDTSDNDWDDIVDTALFGTASYGTPFVLSYSNNGTGYAANTLAYDYYTDATGKVPAGTAMGCYESNTSTLARGTGELVIDQYADMLTILKTGYLTYECPQCGEEVEWSPLTAKQASVATLSSGHYYLYENILTGSAQKLLGSKDNVNNDAVQICLDLNGKTMQTTGRSFSVYKASTLTVLDTSQQQTGKVISYSGNNNVGGGVFNVSSGATLNILSGTYQFIRTEEGVNEPTPTSKGGVISSSGTVNMSGGALIGDQLGIAGNDANGNPYLTAGNGCGGTVSVNGGTFNVSGGRVLSGKAAEGGAGDCVYLDSTSCKIVLSGDACVDGIYINSFKNTCVTVSGAYTGTAAITVNPETTLGSGAYLGKSSSADLSSANLTLTNDGGKYDIGIYGSYLITSEKKDSTVATVTGSIGVRYFDSVQDAIDAWMEGSVVTLLANDLKYARVVEDDVCIDLNGYDMLWAFVIDGCTLYVKDSATDDYDVSDGVYGQIGTVEGNVAPMNGYMKVTEDDGISSHKVDLELKTLTLRPSDVGMYYKSDFKADTVAAEHIQSFGVALSIVDIPTTDNLETLCEKTTFEGFVGGADGNNNETTSSVLINIMRPENGYMRNRANATAPVYGRAYLLTDDGYVFGTCVAFSLRDALEGADDIWSELDAGQQTALSQLYTQYRSVLYTWDLPNMKNAALSA